MIGINNILNQEFTAPMASQVDASGVFYYPAHVAYNMPQLNASYLNLLLPVDPTKTQGTKACKDIQGNENKETGEEGEERPKKRRRRRRRRPRKRKNKRRGR